ncbi:MAG: hypothetical protein GY757_48000 [bacterium]|nr:hypothetical protein [bacterium]
MRSVVFFILPVLLVVFTAFCGDAPKKEKTYPDQLIGALKKGDMLALNSKIKSIEGALQLYYSDNNEYPEMLDELVPKYLKTATYLLDPWGTQFEIETDDDMNLVIISAGKDRSFDSDDDIRRRI